MSDLLPIKAFKSIASRAHSVTKMTFGMKLHLVLDSNRKFVAFSLSPGQNHDVSRAKKLLQQFKGQVIGNSGYISNALKKWLEKRGLVNLNNFLEKNFLDSVA